MTHFKVVGTGLCAEMKGSSGDAKEESSGTDCKDKADNSADAADRPIQKNDLILWITLSEEQRKLYRAFLESESEQSTLFLSQNSMLIPLVFIGMSN